MNIFKSCAPKAANTVQEQRDGFYGMLDHFLGNDFFSTGLMKSDWNPRVDIVEKEKSVIVKADVPGVDEKHLEVTVDDGFLTIKGSREEEQKVEEKGYSRFERSSGSFSRSIELPDSVDTNSMKAEYKKGVLTVEIAKSKEAERKKVSVKVS